MNISPAKENILKRIRKALTQSTPIPFSGSEGNSPVFEPIGQDREIEFAEQFTRLLGRFSYCASIAELSVQLLSLFNQEKLSRIYCAETELLKLLPPEFAKVLDHEDLVTCEAAVTTCECLIARTGSIMMTAAGAGGRTASVYAPIHICVAYTSQLVDDVRDGLTMVKEKYGNSLPSLVTFATGPSRTADIEKTLVVGVHGPREVYVFLVQD